MLFRCRKYIRNLTFCLENRGKGLDEMDASHIQKCDKCYELTKMVRDRIDTEIIRRKAMMHEKT